MNRAELNSLLLYNADARKSTKFRDLLRTEARASIIPIYAHMAANLPHARSQCRRRPSGMLAWQAVAFGVWRPASRVGSLNGELRPDPDDSRAQWPKPIDGHSRTQKRAITMRKLRTRRTWL
ncbi:hypothetical protein MTO96_023236 [Rhipicephalus appendiculatus]